MDGTFKFTGAADLFKSPYVWASILFAVGCGVALYLGIVPLAVTLGALAGLSFLAGMFPALTAFLIVAALIGGGVYMFFSTRSGVMYKETLRSVVASRLPEDPEFMRGLSKHASEAEMAIVRKLKQKDGV